VVVFSQVFLAIYSQIAPKIMRWYQVFKTKTQKAKRTSQLDEKVKQAPQFSKIWMKISNLDGKYHT
jgi:hypothetical protein